MVSYKDFIPRILFYLCLLKEQMEFNPKILKVLLFYLREKKIYKQAANQIPEFLSRNVACPPNSSTPVA